MLPTPVTRRFALQAGLVITAAVSPIVSGCGTDRPGERTPDERRAPAPEPLEREPVGADGDFSTTGTESLLASTSAAPRPFDELERLWTAQLYAEALPLLIEYRSIAPYGKNEVVDYMIGTSACRVAGQEAFGHRMLAWVLARYSLSQESREMVRSELDRCPPAARIVPVSLSLVGVGPASTSGTRGKTFYMVGRGTDVPLANEPVTVLSVIPAEQLEARLFPLDRREEAAALVARLSGDGYRAVAEGAFVLASRTHTEPGMREIARGLTRFLDFYAETFGIPRPPHLISVYLARDEASMRQLAERVHGLGLSRMSIGYSFRDDLSMVGIIPGEIYGTLAHELFHLMVRRDFGDVPPWLDEGLAALYEVSRIGPDGRIRGVPNWRGPVLKELWWHRPAIGDLVRADWRAFEAADGEGEPIRQAANHATARYFLLHLQERGLLVDVYRAVRERNAVSGSGDPGMDAVAALERVTGRSVSELDTEFSAWFEGLRHD
jgi:hypothetical protein